jgi:hypothetical protein
MSTSTHRIRRQQWALKARSEADAFEIRTQLRQVWETGLQPAFQAAFDELAGAKTVRIPRLEVRVTVTDLHELVNVVQERLRQELGRLLDAAEAEAPREDKAFTVTHGQEGVLSHYLRAGNLPWHALERDSGAAIRALEYEARASLEVPLDELRGMAGDEARLAAGIFRLLQLLPETLWRSAAERFLGATMRPAWIELLDEIAGSRDDAMPRQGRIRLMAGLMTALVTTREPGLSRVVTAVVASWTRETGLRTPRKLAGLVERLPIDSEPLAEAGGRPQRLGAAEVVAAAAPDCGQDAEPSGQTHDDRFPVAVASAGLVLLHPFLSQLFTTVGIVLSEGVRPESPVVARAAALLHLLATGREEPYEIELGFIKVLLGFTPETSLLVAGGLLSDTDREEAEALLHAAVGHWTALKRTSVGALRASFLQRTGLLGREEDDWLLRIERGPFDVLLERLPWGIGTVKLPWMSRPIFCKWPTA